MQPASELRHSGVETCIKLFPVISGEALTIRLGVNLLLLSIAAFLNPNVEISGYSSILVENVFKHAWMGRVDPFHDLIRVFLIASTSAVLDSHGAFSGKVAVFFYLRFT